MLNEIQKWCNGDIVHAEQHGPVDRLIECGGSMKDLEIAQTLPDRVVKVCLNAVNGANGAWCRPSMPLRLVDRMGSSRISLAGDDRRIAAPRLWESNELSVDPVSNSAFRSRCPLGKITGTEMAAPVHRPAIQKAVVLSMMLFETMFDNDATAYYVSRHGGSMVAQLAIRYGRHCARASHPDRSRGHRANRCRSARRQLVPWLAAKGKDINPAMCPVDFTLNRICMDLGDPTRSWSQTSRRYLVKAFRSGP